jgi:hypothetical protein
MNWTNFDNFLSGLQIVEKQEVELEEIVNYKPKAVSFILVTQYYKDKKEFKTVAENMIKFLQGITQKYPDLKISALEKNLIIKEKIKDMKTLMLEYKRNNQNAFK